jgi:hypothetical protein
VGRRESNADEERRGAGGGGLAGDRRAAWTTFPSRPGVRLVSRVGWRRAVLHGG